MTTGERDHAPSVAAPPKHYHQSFAARDACESCMATIASAAALRAESVAAPALEYDATWRAFEAYEEKAAKNGSGMTREQMTGAAMMLGWLHSRAALEAAPPALDAARDWWIEGEGEDRFDWLEQLLRTLRNFDKNKKGVPWHGDLDLAEALSALHALDRLRAATPASGEPAAREVLPMTDDEADAIYDRAVREQAVRERDGGEPPQGALCPFCGGSAGHFASHTYGAAPPAAGAEPRPPQQERSRRDEPERPVSRLPELRPRHGISRRRVLQPNDLPA